MSERIDTRRYSGQASLGRHVFVDEPPERPGGFCGVLPQWSQGADGTWVGLVAYALPDVDGHCVLT